MHGYTRYPTILRHIIPKCGIIFFYIRARERVSRVPAKKVTETIIYRFDLIAYRRTYYNNLLDTAVVTYTVCGIGSTNRAVARRSRTLCKFSGDFLFRGAAAATFAI